MRVVSPFFQESEGAYYTLDYKDAKLLAKTFSSGEISKKNKELGSKLTDDEEEIAIRCKLCFRAKERLCQLHQEDQSHALCTDCANDYLSSLKFTEDAKEVLAIAMKRERKDELPCFWCLNSCSGFV